MAKDILARIKHFFEVSDIRMLVFAPPTIGFIGVAVVLFIAGQLVHGRPSQFFLDMTLGALFLTPVFSGIAEVYKQEMPGPLGKAIRGKVAVVSGIIIIVMFGIGSIVSFISAFAHTSSK